MAFVGVTQVTVKLTVVPYGLAGDVPTIRLNVIVPDAEPPFIVVLVDRIYAVPFVENVWVQLTPPAGVGDGPVVV
jgi:hypothetical protein